MTKSSELIMEFTKGLLPGEVNEEGLESVKNFSLIWNIYEGMFFNKNASGKEIFKRDIRAPKSTAYETFLTIRSRYVDIDSSNLTKYYYGLFNGRDFNEEQKVQEILLSREVVSEEEINMVCRMVSWRYRCNLIHGEKNAYYLFQNNSLFEVLNIYLIGSIMGRQL